MDDGKTRFWREIIITIGILPGLWLFLGVDPEAQITYAVIGQICQFISSIVGTGTQSLSSFAFFVYAVVGFVSEILSWVGVYLVGGAWGLLAVGAAFIGAITIDEPFGIWLILGALLVAPFLPVDDNHSLDTRY